MRVIVGIALLASLLGAIVVPAAAYVPLRPDVPSCLSAMSWGRDDFTFQICRSAMVAYQSDMESYLRALRNESNQAREEHDASVQKFNCYSRGEPFCP